MTGTASHIARQADLIFLGTLAVSVVLLIGITAAMVYFVVRYERRRNPVPADIRTNLPLEITWTIIPTIIVLVMFYFGLIGFRDMRKAPPDAMDVKVTARMWSWSFEYGNGRTANELRLPLGKPVRLALASEDVLHSFFVPAFRIKEDAVPGVDTYLWFLPEREGTYDVLCAEYCGLGHSAMLSKVIVMPPEEFAAWYGREEAAEGPGAETLLAEKGCIGCHSLDGTKKVGPSFKDLFGRNVVVVTDGAERSIVVDRDYLRRSILDPKADIVKGFPPVMPPQGDALSDDELERILDYFADTESGGTSGEPEVLQPAVPVPKEEPPAQPVEPTKPPVERPEPTTPVQRDEKPAPEKDEAVEPVKAKVGVSETPRPAPPVPAMRKPAPPVKRKGPAEDKPRDKRPEPATPPLKKEVPVSPTKPASPVAERPQQAPPAPKTERPAPPPAQPGAPTAGADKGKKLVFSKGCTACHSLDGSRVVGPTFKGISGRRQTVVTGGKEHEITADRTYLRRSILEPQADIVNGYPPAMPPQGGVLSAEELEAVLDFLESQTGDPP